MSKKATKQSRRTAARKERQRATRVLAELPIRRALPFGNRGSMVTIDVGVLAIMDGFVRGIRR